MPFMRRVEATFFEHHPDVFQRPMERDSTFRIPLVTVLTDRTDMRIKDVMPTIGLHAIQLPSGGIAGKLHETANKHLRRRLRDRAGRDRRAGRPSPYTRRRAGSAYVGMITFRKVLRMRPLLRATDEPIVASFGRCATLERTTRPTPSPPAVGNGRSEGMLMPKGYIYAEPEVTDPALFETYRPLAAASISEFGGCYAVRGCDPKVLEGDGPPPRSVLLEFGNHERAMAWDNSPQYQVALQIRLRSAKTKVLMLTGNSEGEYVALDALWRETMLDQHPRLIAAPPVGHEWRQP
jgi:uncharacterized protein (DUF1330 family)